MMKRLSYLDALKSRVLIYDGAMGTSIDDYDLTFYDEFERFKKFKPDKKKVVGSTPIILREDNDEKFEFYDI